MAQHNENIIYHYFLIPNSIILTETGPLTHCGGWILFTKLNVLKIAKGANVTTPTYLWQVTNAQIHYFLFHHLTFYIFFFVHFEVNFLFTSQLYFKMNLIWLFTLDASHEGNFLRSLNYVRAIFLSDQFAILKESFVTWKAISMIRKSH